MILNKRRAFEPAVEAFKRALDADPDNTGANVSTWLARFNPSVGMPQAFITSCVRRNWPQTNILCGSISPSLYLAAGLNADAIAAYRRGLELAPDHGKPDILAMLKQAQDKPKRSLSGSALFAKGDVVGALPLLEAESKADPHDAVVAQNLGLVLLHSGFDEKARTAFENLHRIEPDNRVAWLYLMRLAAKRGDLADALRWCDKYAAIPEMRAKSKAFRAYVLDDCRELQKAKKCLSEAMKEHPEESELFIAYGDIAMKHRMPSEAVRGYGAAVHCIKSQPYDIQWLREIERRLRDAEFAAGSGAT